MDYFKQDKFNDPLHKKFNIENEGYIELHELEGKESDRIFKMDN